MIQIIRQDKFNVDHADAMEMWSAAGLNNSYGDAPSKMKAMELAANALELYESLIFGIILRQPVSQQHTIGFQYMCANAAQMANMAGDKASAYLWSSKALEGNTVIDPTSMAILHMIQNETAAFQFQRSATYRAKAEKHARS